MPSNLSFDEINKLVGQKRSMSYKEYFGEMGLTEKQKKERVLLAEKIEDAFLDVFILMVTMRQYNRFDWDKIENGFKNAYLNVLKAFKNNITDSTLKAENLARELVRASQRHINDDYYFSQDRLTLISEEESNNIHNEKDFHKAINSGKRFKQWKTMMDNRVRETHTKVNGKKIPIDDYFLVGGSLMKFPRDPSGDSDEIIGCRCWLIYS